MWTTRIFGVGNSKCYSFVFYLELIQPFSCFCYGHLVVFQYLLQLGSREESTPASILDSRKARATQGFHESACFWLWDILDIERQCQQYWPLGVLTRDAI